jgi:hypothetical protein
MALEQDISCLHRGTVVRARQIAWGVRDERSSFDCPACGKTLFSWEQPAVYDILGIVRRPEVSQEEK